MSKEFYVYVYLDPRKKGNYDYGDYIFENEPFYVGKGNGYRFKDHLKNSKLKNNKENFLKNRKLNSILKSGLKPIIKIIFKSKNEKDALNVESKLIKTIGRKILKTGTLTNLTDGGDGGKNRFVTDEFRNKQSEIMKRHYKNNPISQETKKKISEILLNKKMTRSKETKEKISKANTNRKFSDEHIQHLKTIRKGPRLTRRKKYKLISPDNEIFNFLGKAELVEFIHKNKLSVRKMLSNINKGVIELKNVRKKIKGEKINTQNCVGWQLIKEL